MPGKIINQKQIGLYMKYRKEGKSQAAAAAKADFSERSARNIENREYREAKVKREWRTRKDPLEEVWDPELVLLLEKNPNLQARTILEYLQQKYEGKYPDSLLRTLQRRIQNWKALHGPEKEVIFRQKHPPGWQGLSDFTSATKLQVTVNGELLTHNFYHYRLAYSGWEHVEVILGGESFSALAESLQAALWLCGGSPETHRTDSLSAAFKNLTKEEKKDATSMYEELVEHYGIEPTRNNKGVSHENGTVEVSHRHLKSRVDQALMIRGSRDFKNLQEYREFIRKIIKGNNQRVRKEYLEELAHLKPLPERKTADFTEERVKVTNSSTIRVKSVVYSVPSRLIGSTLKVHLFDDRLELFVGGQKTLTLERKRNHKKNHHIDYRHLVGQLMQKPGAFRNYIYKEELFPTLAFRLTWEELIKELGSRKACREYVGILKEAAYENRENQVSIYLEKRLRENQVAKWSDVRKLFRQPQGELPSVKSTCDDLEEYDQFIGVEL